MCMYKSCHISGDGDSLHTGLLSVLSVCFLTHSFLCLLFFSPQIRIASRLNAKTILDIDNAKLAADDFKMK